MFYVCEYPVCGPICISVAIFRVKNPFWIFFCILCVIRKHWWRLSYCALWKDVACRQHYLLFTETCGLVLFLCFNLAFVLHCLSHSAQVSFELSWIKIDLFWIETYKTNKNKKITFLRHFNTLLMSSESDNDLASIPSLLQCDDAF